MTDCGYTFDTSMGENIAYGYPTAAAVVQGWLNSAGHRGNIEYGGYVVSGISAAATLNGVDLLDAGLRRLRRQRPSASAAATAAPATAPAAATAATAAAAATSAAPATAPAASATTAGRRRRKP